MARQKRRIIITAALPYANGDIHLGHLLEHSIVDFWTRFQKMRGHECAFICADDTHGSPIMIAARNQNITPEELITRSHKDHERDFAGFEIQFDNYSSTNTAANKALTEEVYRKMEENGHIEIKQIEQAYCETDKMFLPDRFVRGSCPKCKTEDQYGDSCDECNATYSPLDLIDAKCTLCGNKPLSRKTEHLFFKLNNFKEYLESWVPKHCSKEVYNKLKEWFKEDLQDWCISRDAPYFGFEAPGHPGKYLYVWVDAPIGYISSTQEWCVSGGHKLEDYWRSKDTEIYHCIGKDIIYFHILFWPAMLKNAGYTTPNSVFVHGMLTVNGMKMSKSRGTFINASTYLKHLSPLYLRYYFASKIHSSIEDLDLSLNDFVARVNSDLIGKITNVASRGVTMLHKLDGVIGTLKGEGRQLVEAARNKGEIIASHYENRDFSKAIIEIRSIADDANKYFDNYEPWKLIKVDREKTKEVLTTIINLFRVMAVYLKPIIPSYVAECEKLFNEKPYTWDSAMVALENCKINKYSHLIKRLDSKKLDKIVEESKPKDEVRNTNTKEAANAPSEIAPLIEFDDFMKVDLRVAKIVEARHVEKAAKLLQLTLDLGGGITKNVFAGIKSAYKPEELEGRLTVMVANLQPRKMKFGVSEGMVVCASGATNKDLFLLTPDSGAKPGDRIS